MPVNERSRLVKMSRPAVCIGCGAEIKAGGQAWYASSREAGYRCPTCGKHPEGFATNWVPMVAKFAGKCRTCGKVIDAGEKIWWRKTKPHYVRCMGCGKKPAAMPEPQPEPTPEPEPQPGTVGEHPAIRGIDGIHRYEYGSISEATELAVTSYAQTDSGRIDLDGRQHGYWGGDFYNFYSKDRLLGELSNPSQGLVDAVQQMRDRLSEELALPTTPRRKIRRGQDYGDEVDVDRWLARDPYMWDRNVREQNPSRTVTIGCNIAVSCGRKPHELLWRGAAALALADFLNERGVNVQIVVFKAVEGPAAGVSKGVIRYTVKDATMPLDVNSLALAMCEIGWCRAVAVHGGARHWPGKLQMGLGTPCNLPAADAKGIDYLIEQTVVTQEGADAWLRAAVSRHDAEVAHV